PAVLLSSMSIFAPGLSIEKRTTTIAIISLSVAALNTVLNFTLVPVLGIRGAALSTLVSASLGFLTYVVLSQRLYHVPHRWGALAFATIATIIAGGLGSLFAFGVWWNTLLRLIEMIAITLLFIRLGLISRSDIVRGWHRLRELVGYKPERRIA
ncbi:MAG TPA: polysaccharide biosynthesis C-terminal domain-containing protein, partial [Gemmatimonadaceae bacterium]|nr:polysaccharide biosynthesis C-terminal domain-containing protein [Gemmatimonadaceae bacterium]